MRYLLVDIGSTYTKVCLVDAVSGSVLGMERAPTTIADDVNNGIAAACVKLGALITGDERTLVCSSAAGGLKIAAVGLVPELTLKAARLAALGAGGRVLKAYAYELTRNDVAEIQAACPDLLILAGGTDGGNREYILNNAGIIARDLPDVPVVVAGNRSAYDAVRDLFGAREAVQYTDNVMPAFGDIQIEPARECIRKLFLERIVRAKGLDRLRNDAQVLLPTPLAVHRAAALLADGIDGEAGVGELLVIDMGGATTDVVSIGDGHPASPDISLKGLPDPREKRTVEGDIGMRYSLAPLVDQIDAYGLDNRGIKALKAWAGAIESDMHRLPAGDDERECELRIAGLGCRIALERHCGRIETAYTPQGEVRMQYGKDAGGFRRVIGTGGVLAGAAAAGGILEAALAGTDPMVLRPRNPVCSVDRNYIMWAMGLLAAEEPACALKIMKRELL